MYLRAILCTKSVQQCGLFLSYTTKKRRWLQMELLHTWQPSGIDVWVIVDVLCGSAYFFYSNRGSRLIQLYVSVEFPFWTKIFYNWMKMYHNVRIVCHRWGSLDSPHLISDLFLDDWFQPCVTSGRCYWTSIRKVAAHSAHTIYIAISAWIVKCIQCILYVGSRIWLITNSRRHACLELN